MPIADATSARPSSNTSPFSPSPLLAWGWMQCCTCIIDRPQACQAFWLCVCVCVCVCVCDREKGGRQKVWTRMAPLAARGSAFIKNMFCLFSKGALDSGCEAVEGGGGFELQQIHTKQSVQVLGNLLSKAQFSSVLHTPSLALPHLSAAWRLGTLIFLSRSPCLPTPSCFPLMFAGPPGRPRHLQLFSD